MSKQSVAAPKIMKIPVPKVIEGIQCFPIIDKTASEIRAMQELEINEDRFDEEYPDWIGFGCPCKKSYELGSTIAAPSLNYARCHVHSGMHGHFMHVREGFALNRLPIYSQNFLREMIRALPHLFDLFRRPEGFCREENVRVLEELLMPHAAALPVAMTNEEKKYLSVEARTQFYDEYPIVYFLL